MRLPLISRSSTKPQVPINSFEESEGGIKLKQIPKTKINKNMTLVFMVVKIQESYTNTLKNFSVLTHL